MASDTEHPFAHFMAPLDGANGDDAAARLARRFAICSLLVTVTVAVASAWVCGRCPSREVAHIANTAGVRG
jgi:hypothetical protein